jgi:hypothetical protein
MASVACGLQAVTDQAPVAGGACVKQERGYGIFASINTPESQSSAHSTSVFYFWQIDPVRDFFWRAITARLLRNRRDRENVS